MENQIEKDPHHIPSKEEVVDLIARFAEKAAIVRELSDGQGVYLLEAQVEGEGPGETVQYEYMRAGVFPNGNQSLETSIHKVYYVHDMPVGGELLAEYDQNAREWKV